MEVPVNLGRKMPPDTMTRNDIPSEIEGIQYLTLSQETIWNAARDREIQCPLTQVENRRLESRRVN
jgi:hypothetical protein